MNLPNDPNKCLKTLITQISNEPEAGIQPELFSEEPEEGLKPVESS
jgi:hypothetical protein